MDEIKTIPLENSLKFLRFQRIWPKTEEELYRGKLFYVKFILLTFSTSVLFWGSLSHMIWALYVKNGAQIDFDISMIISITGTYYFNFFYIVNVKKIAKAFKDLSNYEIFGKPPGINDFNRKMNTFSKYHQIYISIAILLLSTAKLLEIKECKAYNELKGIKDVCGLVTNFWVPFDVDYFPVKHIIYLVQMYSGYFSFAISSTISFSVMESMEHVIFRMVHVKTLFVEALNKKVYDLGHCIEYHNFVISIAQELSESYSSCIFVHVLLTGAILGCNGFQLLQGLHLNTVALFVGWFMSLLMVASVGQHLIDECFEFRDVIYNTEWYNLDLRVQKVLILILMRSKKPIYLRAGAFGFMSYQVVLSILKTSYSIVSLMKGTS